MSEKQLLEFLTHQSHKKHDLDKLFVFHFLKLLVVFCVVVALL